MLGTCEPMRDGKLDIALLFTDQIDGNSHVVLVFWYLVLALLTCITAASPTGNRYIGNITTLSIATVTKIFSVVS